VRVWPEAGCDQERRFRLPPVYQENVPSHHEAVDRPGADDVLPLGDQVVENTNASGGGY